MASNAVEATLRSKYEDGIQEGIENTRALMERTFAAMKDAGAGANAALESAFESTVGAMENFRKNLSKAADDSDSSFKRIGLAAAAMAVGSGELLLRAGKAAADFVIELVKESSEVAEARINFEALTAAQGENADMMLGKLKEATEGQIGQLTLLRNANKVMQSDLPITGEQYLRLVENVARLAKGNTDAAGAQDALTNALLRGMARGLEPAIGIHLAVKDAVTAMTEEMNTSAASMPDRSKLQAFYNDLLDKTDQAVAKLGPRFLTLEEAITAGETTWSNFLQDVGTAITRSGVFQGILQDVTGKLDSQTSSIDSQRQMALKVNDALIALLRGLAAIAEALGYVSAAWDGFKDLLAAADLLIVNGMVLISQAVLGMVGAVVQALSELPGAAGRAFQPMLQWLKSARDELQIYGQGASDALSHSFDGFGDSKTKLDGFAESTRKLADQMEQLRNTVIDGSSGIQKHGAAAQQAAVDQQKLNDQLKLYHDLMFGFAQANAQTPQEKAMNDLVHTLGEIQQLNLISAGQRQDLENAAWDKYWNTINRQYEEDKARQIQQNDEKLAAQAEYQQQVRQLQSDLFMATASDELKAAATRSQDIDKVNQLVGAKTEAGKALLLLVEKKYDEAMAKIEADRLKKQQEDEQKALNDALAAANTIVHAVESAQKGAISQSMANQALGNVPKVLDELKAKLAALKAQPVITDEQITNIEKLQAAILQLNKLNLSPFRQMLQQLKDQMQQMGQQITQSWGQFWSDLASGQENAGKKFLGSLLQMAGQQLEMLAITQTAKAIAAAADLDFAGAIRHGAAAAALGALGGILSGIGSSLGNSSSQPSQAAAPTTGVTTTSSAPSQTLQAGAPAPRQPVQPPQQHTITLQVQSNDSHIVKVVKNDINNNGQLRVAVKRA